jgi:hypothetical protein
MIVFFTQIFFELFFQYKAAHGRQTVGGGVLRRCGVIHEVSIALDGFA